MLIAPDILSKNYISRLRISVEEFYLQIKQKITYHPVVPEKEGLLIIPSFNEAAMYGLGELITSCDHSAPLCLIQKHGYAKELKHYPSKWTSFYTDVAK